MLAISAGALRPAVNCEIVITNWEVGTGKWEVGREVGNRKLVNPDGECSKTMSGIWDDPVQSLCRPGRSDE